VRKQEIKKLRAGEERKEEMEIGKKKKLDEVNYSELNNCS
jgi:hypothetical protein